MEYRSGTETYYRQMLELTDKLRKSEEERLKLEGQFNEIMQQSRDAEYERLRIMRHKYHKFLEEDKARQERNENILRTLDRIESRAKQLAAKTDRFKAFRKQYFENYLKQIPKQKQQTFDYSSNTQQTNRPQYQNESVRRKLFTNEPTTIANDNVETKLALLENYLRDNFDNFPRDFPASATKQNGTYDRKQTHLLYDNKKYLDDASDSKESQEIEVEKYSPSKLNGHYQKSSELLGNRIELELDRLRNKKENELNNNSLDAQEINSEQVINDYKKLVSKSEEKYGLRNDLLNGSSKKAEVFDSIKKIAQIDGANKLQMDMAYNVDEKEESNLKLNLLEEEENSEDTKPPTDISLNLSTPSQLKEQIDDSKPEMNNEENSSKSEEITSIEKQKVQSLQIQRKGSNIIETKPILSQFDDVDVKTPEISNNKKQEQQNDGYDSNDNTNQQYIEKHQSNEFGESVATEQQYSAPKDENQEHYDDEIQSTYKQDNENITLQRDKREVNNEQQYENPEQQFQNTESYGNSEYKNPEHQFEVPENQYPQSEQQYVNPDQQYKSPEQQYKAPEQYINPEQQYVSPEQQYENSEKQEYPPQQQEYPSEQQEYPQEPLEYPTEQQEYPPEQQAYPPVQQEYLPEQQEYPPEQQAYPPEQQEYPPEQQAYPPEQQEYPPEQQEYPPELQEYPPEQQEYPPEQQEYPPEQPEFPPENYDQQYPQETYAEGEYDPQNYPQAYETQQPENYDAQNYPQQQYPEGYDPQQYTEQQQLEYDQQYPPQAESYPDQQFVENTGEYDPQGQYPENLYQTGQEYLQGEQNADLQYEAEQQQDYPEGYVGPEIEQDVTDGQANKTVIHAEGNESAAISEQEQEQLEDNKPLVQKKLPNLADMLDTDTSESVKPDSKVSDSDFDFSNTKT